MMIHRCALVLVVFGIAETAPGQEGPVRVGERVMIATAAKPVSLQDDGGTVVVDDAVRVGWLWDVMKVEGNRQWLAREDDRKAGWIEADRVARAADAEKALGREVEAKPPTARAYDGRGVARSELERYDEAITDFDEAIRLDPDDGAAYEQRGHALYGLRRFAEAVAAYEQAVKRDPKACDAWRAMAWLRATCSVDAVRNGPKAVEAARRACDLGGDDDVASRMTLAAALAENEDTKQAASVIESVITQLESAGDDLDADRSLLDQSRALLEHFRAGLPFHDRPDGEAMSDDL
jgi:tetratricopeptide (TPR) repeat protein